MKRIQKEVESREPGTEQPDDDIFDSPYTPASSSRGPAQGAGTTAQAESPPGAALPGPAQPQGMGHAAPVATSESASQLLPGNGAPSSLAEPPPKPVAQPRIDFYYPGRKVWSPGQ